MRKSTKPPKIISKICRELSSKPEGHYERSAREYHSEGPPLANELLRQLRRVLRQRNGELLLPVEH